MKSALTQHIQQFVKAPPVALSAIGEGMTRQLISKKDFLLQQDQYCHHQYFVVQGCFRCFYRRSAARRFISSQCRCVEIILGISLDLTLGHIFSPLSLVPLHLPGHSLHPGCQRIDSHT